MSMRRCIAPGSIRGGAVTRCHSRRLTLSGWRCARFCARRSKVAAPRSTQSMRADVTRNVCGSTGVPGGRVADVGPRLRAASSASARRTTARDVSRRGFEDAMAGRQATRKVTDRAGYAPDAGWMSRIGAPAIDVDCPGRRAYRRGSVLNAGGDSCWRS